MAFINENTYVRVGNEMRHMRRGAPMGEPASCAQANAVCMHAEQRFHRARERECGDSARIASLAFVDDLQPRVGYDMDDCVWTRQEAEALLDDIRGMYPPPLSLE